MRKINFTIENIDYPSTNSIYASKHWSVRQKLSTEWHDTIGWIFKKLYPGFMLFQGKLKIDFIFHKKGHEMDIDNFSYTEKLIIDALKGIAYEDDKQIFKASKEKVISDKNFIEIKLESFSKSKYQIK